MTQAANPLPPDAAARRRVRAWLQAHAAAGADLRVDSRQVERGDVFLALRGRVTDGRRFVDQALDRGASAILVDDCDQPAPPTRGVPTLAVAGLGPLVPAIASDHYEHPTERLRSIGITGTNGKTSSCHWIAQLLGACGEACASIGTLGYGFRGELDPQERQLTTPEAVDLQRLAARAVREGARALATEATSIGLAQGRLDEFRFHVALFTNLTRDHLDFHGDMDSYARAKRRLFERAGLEAAVLNLDDPLGRDWAAELLAEAPRRLRVYGVATQAGHFAGLALPVRLLAQDIEHHAQGVRFEVLESGEVPPVRARVDSPLVGGFNVPNLLGVLAVARACGIPLEAAAAAAAALRPPPGRLQRVEAAGGSGPLAVIDYAHTPDAIAQALQALRPLVQARGGRLWIVFGAGGDRDPGKRPAMAAAAAAGADRLVLTSDNPRGEPPQAILDQIAAGVPRGFACEQEVERGRAIERALAQADGRDVVLIAGKGHEPYQEIAGRRLPFSDVEAARAALQARARGQA